MQSPVVLVFGIPRTAMAARGMEGRRATTKKDVACFGFKSDPEKFFVCNITYTVCARYVVQAARSSIKPRDDFGTYKNLYKR